MIRLAGLFNMLVKSCTRISKWVALLGILALIIKHHMKLIGLDHLKLSSKKNGYIYKHESILKSST